MLRFSAAVPALVVALAFGAVGCESEHHPTCGEGPTTGNNDVPESFAIEVGRTAGVVPFHYETRNAKDQVQVFYEGQLLFDSGCVGETGDVKLPFGPGRSTEIDVVMNPNCSGTAMTSWLFEVGCPAPAIRKTAKTAKPRPKTADKESTPRR